jgi:hypothetical protein
MSLNEALAERQLLKLDDAAVAPSTRLQRAQDLVRNMSHNHRGMLFDGEPTLWRGKISVSLLFNWPQRKRQLDLQKSIVLENQESINGHQI